MSCSEQAVILVYLELKLEKLPGHALLCPGYNLRQLNLLLFAPGDSDRLCLPVTDFQGRADKPSTLAVGAVCETPHLGHHFGKVKWIVFRVIILPLPLFACVWGSWFCPVCCLLGDRCWCTQNLENLQTSEPEEGVSATAEQLEQMDSGPAGLRGLYPQWDLFTCKKMSMLISGKYRQERLNHPMCSLKQQCPAGLAQTR